MNEHNHKWYDLPQSTTAGTATTSKCSGCDDVKYKNTSLGIEQVVHKDSNGNIAYVAIKILGDK